MTTPTVYSSILGVRNLSKEEFTLSLRPTLFATDLKTRGGWQDLVETSIGMSLKICLFLVCFQRNVLKDPSVSELFCLLHCHLC